jgi:hypothetical protein
VIDSASRLDSGGLLIVQSYCSGIDTGHEPEYLGACQVQLHKIGLSLLEVHRFKRNRGITLYVAVKGASRRPLNRPIRKFHGRGTAERVERIFPAGFVRTRQTFGEKVRTAFLDMRQRLNLGARLRRVARALTR